MERHAQCAGIYISTKVNIADRVDLKLRTGLCVNGYEIDVVYVAT